MLGREVNRLLEHRAEGGPTVLVQVVLRDPRDGETKLAKEAVPAAIPPLAYSLFPRRTRARPDLQYLVA